MNTPQAIIVSGVIISAAVIFHDSFLIDKAYASQESLGRYVALQTEAIIRVNVIDTYTGAVRHCWTADHQQNAANCSQWVGGK